MAGNSNQLFHSVIIITLTLALTCPLDSVSATCWGNFNGLITSRGKKALLTQITSNGDIDDLNS